MRFQRSGACVLKRGQLLFPLFVEESRALHPPLAVVDKPVDDLRLMYHQLSTAELKVIVDSFNDTSDVKKVQSEGFYAGGVRFVTIRADDRRLYGKKVRENTTDIFPHTNAL